MLLTATIVAFTFRSSAFVPAFQLGKYFRWPLLIVLTVFAVWWALSRPPASRFPPLLALVTAAFLTLGLVSEGWTVRSHLTLARTFSFGLVLVTAAATALGGAGRPDVARRLLTAILAGAIIAAALGIPLLFIPHGHAVQAASSSYPARYQGLGQNPNTVPLLLAIAMPIALWLLGTSRNRRDQALLGGVVLLFLGQIVAGNSRGALLGATVGTILLAFLAIGNRRRRLVAVTAAAAVAAAAFGAMAIPSPAAATNDGPRPTSRPTTRDAERVRPLQAEIGGPSASPARPVRRSLLSSSGRGEAWRGAVAQALDRPVVGYGFGTESSVFVDRYRYFYSTTPENTYLGAFLQLGAVGLLLFVTLVLTLLVLGVRTLLRPAATARREIVAVGTAVFAAGLVIAVTQTYLLSAGNLATVSVWICGFLAAVFGTSLPERQKGQPREREVDAA
jgi:O-antigen ligase